MKLIKLTMLAATAAIAAMAFIGASAASAESISLCRENNLSTCATQVTAGLPGRIILLVAAGEFKSPNITVKCTSGLGNTNQVEPKQEPEFKATLESLTFSGCTGCNVAVIVPQATALSMSGAAWTLTANEAGVKFSNCLGLGINCTFKGNLTFNVQMDATSAFADPEGKEFKLSEGNKSLCGETGKWESGRTRVHWELDNAAYPNGTRHVIWPTLP